MKTGHPKMIAVLVPLLLGACSAPPPPQPPAIQEIYKRADYLVHISAEIKFLNGNTFTIIGSGFVISRDNQHYILTAAHLIRRSGTVSKIGPIFGSLKSNQHPDPQELDIVGYNDAPEIDLLVLKFKNREFVYRGSVVELGSSKKLQVGDPVIALGSPLGISHCLSAGVIMRMNAPAVYDSAIPANFIMHSAIINPGNSGGPLLDKWGNVVGMNVSLNYILERTSTPMSLAIPIDQIKKVLPKIIDPPTGGTLR